MNDDASIYRRQNFGNTIGMGQRPALLIVDFLNSFNDPDVFGGGNIGPAVERTVALLAAARDASWPVAFSRYVFAQDGSDRNVFCAKVPGLLALTEDHPYSQVVPELARRPGELIVRKRLPSAFFGTDLTAWLVERRVDTVVMAGCTTSGCIRSSVVDAMSFGFRPIVVRDCVGDRALAPHEANLFDIEQKYADVLDRDELLAALPAAGAAAQPAPRPAGAVT